MKYLSYSLSNLKPSWFYSVRAKSETISSFCRLRNNKIQKIYICIINYQQYHNCHFSTIAKQTFFCHTLLFWSRLIHCNFATPFKSSPRDSRDYWYKKLTTKDSKVAFDFEEIGYIEGLSDILYTFHPSH